ncbi:ornithine decarboxylase [bacterium]|nr:ornithine decarboxylase [bacterium]
MTKPRSTTKPSRGKADELSSRNHYAASQFRSETWNDLKHLTARLEREADRGNDPADLVDRAGRTLKLLRKIEHYWAFPGRATCDELARLLARGWYRALTRHTARVVRLLVSDAYRRRDVTHLAAETEEGDSGAAEPVGDAPPRETRPYFEVLVVDDIDPAEQQDLRRELLDKRRPDDEFIYDVVIVSSLEDALIAVLFNHNIQSCLLRFWFPVKSRVPIPELRHYLKMVDYEALVERAELDPSTALGEAIQALRPELDLFKVTDETLGSVAASRTRCFRRVFYRQEDYLETHLSILKGVRERFDSPFFTALREYSQKPTGVFHALPISRGKSISKSHWIRDMGDFYGRNIFLAETSSTTGGLDSLLQPVGPLKRAQEKVARAFGSRQSFFVTNGTSTANKIVTQALVRPGDIVLLSHDCHKSHPYALMLAGALPVIMDAYPLDEFTMYGGVPLREIKRHLIHLRRAGKLDRVRMLLLTNCTFDGIAYDPDRVMREVLAIKPDMIFLWDEAWFAFARCTPTYRRRTAMAAADRIRDELRSEEYAERYRIWMEEDAPAADDDEAWIDAELLPDPERARMRVYATQSTHKTLTSLRQGSMIHVWDQDFEQKAHDAFHEAYMTHTSTSPNYQILASLDVGRRQVELEGYEFVRTCVGLAMMMRKQITDHPLISKYFRVLKAGDLIPAEHRPSGLERFYSARTGFSRIEEHWREDEFALDPTRVTLHIGATGMDGDTFRKLLIDRFDIQINKTTRNTVLFMLNIGSSHGSVTYLLDVLLQISEELEERAENQSDRDRGLAARRVDELTHQLPPLPNFSRFHPAFVPDPTGGTPEGDLRAAFFLAYDGENLEHFALDGSVASAMESGRTLVSASFVTPYPPGFPILVPGQEVSAEILAYLKAVDVKEIHGYSPEHGLRVFKSAVLERLVSSRATPLPKERVR